MGGAIEVTVRCGGEDPCREFYQDWDGDDAGSELVVSCGPPAGLAEDFALVDEGGDCDELVANIGPNAPEIPGDEIDQNCDGQEECFQDTDGDGERWELETTITSDDTTCSGAGLATADLPATDCDDRDATIGRSIPEIPADGIDQNCDGREDCFIDADGDGISGGEPATSPEAFCDPEEGFTGRPEVEDCDDGNADRFPNAVEIAGDGVDQDCDESELCLLDLDSDGVPGGWSQVESDDVTCADVDGIFTSGDWDCDESGPGTECIDGDDWVLIPAIPTRLGSPDGERLRVAASEPLRDVSFSQPFVLSKTEVTQRQWFEVFGNNPSENFACNDCPVERVSWYDALAYANALSEAAGHEVCYTLDCVGDPGDGMVCSGVTFSARCAGFRLPTAAEWEHSARAGTLSPNYGGVVEETPGSNTAGPQLEAIAVFGGTTQPVGSLAENPWGLVDMIGNVAEWTLDAVPEEAASPPQGGVDPLETEGANRAVRGGGVGGFLTHYRSASQTFRAPSSEVRDVGFRIARTLFAPAE
ncbi:MAG: sulfatase activating formylglycine-generating enzyme [Bradymonadia bacterium]